MEALLELSFQEEIAGLNQKTVPALFVFHCASRKSGDISQRRDDSARVFWWHVVIVEACFGRWWRRECEFATLIYGQSSSLSDLGVK